MDLAIREARTESHAVLRVGLAGLSMAPSRVAAAVLLPCRNVAMAAAQIGKSASRCKTHPRLKAEPTFCAVAVYRGSWEQPDVKFATEVATFVAKGDAPNFDRPRGTNTEIFDTAGDAQPEAETPIVDITAAFAERARGWSSALFPPKSKPAMSEPESSSTALPSAAEPPSSRAPPTGSSDNNAQDRDLFVRRAASERSR